MWQIINEYIILIIVMIGVYLFGKIVLEKKNNSSILKDVFLILLFAIPQTIVKINFTSVMKTSLMFVIDILYYKVQFKINTKQSIFLSFLYIGINFELELF